MQLLDKKSVAQQKSFERKKEIDEGAKLAKTIDALRQTRLEEEKKLSQFREASMSQLKADIKELDDKKSSLLSVVQDLESRKSEALKPLTKEFTLLEQKRREIEVKESGIAIKISQFLEEERKQIDRLEEIELEESRIKEQKSEAEKLILEAVNTSTQSKLLVESATTSAADILEKAKTRDIESKKRELEVSIHERDIINHKKLLDKREDALNKKDRLITDRTGLLIRTEARLKLKRT